MKININRTEYIERGKNPTLYALVIKLLRKNRLIFIQKASCIIVLVTFLTSTITPPNAFAQTVLNLPKPGTILSLSPTYTPACLRGLKVYPKEPLRFDFILDKGDSGLSDSEIKQESTKLIKYFLTTLTVPENDLWVNLSPYEKDRIAPNEFGVTEMGRDLLAQDYLLKQITSSLMYPEKELGQEFWDKVYQKAFEEYGVTDIPVDTFNKVWIVPDKAVVFENEDKAFVVKSRLKVMLEEDYAALEHNSLKDESGQRKKETSNTHHLSSMVIKEIILPAIEKEVNTGKNFALLRQIYQSMVLATWYKRKLHDSVFSKAYVGKNKVNGEKANDKDIKQKIYNQYLESFKKGAYDYVKEEFDPNTQQIVPRKYFSGGAGFEHINAAMTVTKNKKIGMAFLKKFAFSLMVIVGIFLSEPQHALGSNTTYQNQTATQITQNEHDLTKVSVNDVFKKIKTNLNDPKIDPMTKHKMVETAIAHSEELADDAPAYSDLMDNVIKYAQGINDIDFIENTIFPFYMNGLAFLQYNGFSTKYELRRFLPAAVKRAKIPSVAENLSLFFEGFGINMPQSVFHDARLYHLEDKEMLSIIQKNLHSTTPIMRHAALGAINQIIQAPNVFSKGLAAEQQSFINNHLESDILPALFENFKGPSYYMRLQSMDYLENIIKYLNNNGDKEEGFFFNLVSKIMGKKASLAEVLSFLRYRTFEIFTGTMDPQKILAIYEKGTFTDITSDMSPGERFSFARSVELNCKRFNLSISDPKVDKLIKALKDNRDVNKNRVLFDKNTHLIVIANESDMFNPYNFIKLFNEYRKFEEPNTPKENSIFNEKNLTLDLKKASGPLPFEIFRGKSTDTADDYLALKQRIRNAIVNAPGNLVIALLGHGKVDNFYLKGGLSNKSTDMRNDIKEAINNEKDLAQWLIDREKKISAKENTEEWRKKIIDFSDINGVLNVSCLSSDYTLGEYNGIYNLASAEHLSTKNLFPSMSIADFGAVGYSSNDLKEHKGVFVAALDQVLNGNKKDKLFFGDVMKINEALLKGDRVSKIEGMRTFSENPIYFMPSTSMAFNKFYKTLGLNINPSGIEGMGFTNGTIEAIRYKNTYLPGGGVLSIPESVLNKNIPIVNQMGNEAKVVEVNDDLLTVLNLKTLQHTDIELTTMEDVNMDNTPIQTDLKNALVGNSQNGALLDVLTKQLFFPLTKPTFKTFKDEDVVNDLVGYSSPLDRLIALAEGLANNKDKQIRAISFFHELGEYSSDPVIPYAQRLNFEYYDNPSTGNGEITIKIGDQRISDQTIKITRDDTKDIIKNRTKDKHYLLRAVQRELFGEKDVELSKMIRNIQGQRIDNSMTTKNVADVISRNTDLTKGSFTKGGIDLNPNKLGIKTKGEMSNFDLPDVDFKKLNKATGFVPIIIQVTPVTNLNVLLGVLEEDEKNDTLART